MISARTAFATYIALAVLVVLTLDGEPRIVALAVLAVFAVRTYVDIVRRRIAAQEEAEASSDAAAPPAGDVSSGGDS
jgi:hypothetical protein